MPHFPSLFYFPFFCLFFSSVMCRCRYPNKLAHSSTLLTLLMFLIYIFEIIGLLGKKKKKTLKTPVWYPALSEAEGDMEFKQHT